MKRSRKTCRWSLLLLEVVLTQFLLVSVACAAGTGPAVDAVGASTGTSDSLAGPPVVSSGLSDTNGVLLYLDTTVNGTSDGIHPFYEKDGAVWATIDTLKQLGIIIPDGSSDPVRVDQMPQMKVLYDSSKQTVSLTLPLSDLHLATSKLNAPMASATAASSSPGMLLNYDLYGIQGQHGSSSLSAFTEARFFNNWGVLSSTALTQLSRSYYSGENSDWRGQSARLDTTFSHSWPDSLITLNVGDTLTAALPWTRSTRIGGIQLSRNFALQPYLVTAPLPEFLGTAALPSDVELYVNGMRQYSGKVPTGPFQLKTLPSISGAGNAQVMLTDSLGRQTTLNFSLYATQQLLQAGLSDWSVELGAVRKNYGLSSFDYGHEPVASGTWRHGVTNNLTVSVHGEATANLTNAGGGASWLIGNAGVLSGAIAQSQHDGKTGSQANLGYDWRNNHLSFSVGATQTYGSYRDTASLYGAPLPKLSAHAFASYSTDNWGGVGVNYIHLHYPHMAASRYAGAYWLKSLTHRSSLSVNLNQNLNQRGDRSIYIGYSISLDNNTLISASAQRNGDHDIFTVDASQPTPADGGFGWRSESRQGANVNGGQAELDYLGQSARVNAGFQSVGSSSYAYAGASGALVWMGGDVFATRHIDNAFALVSTEGVPSVPVLLSNQVIGKTNDKGLLLVTPLNPYQVNQVSIDALNLPIDLRINRVKANATPSDRAGTLVTFGIHKVLAASVVLVDENGKALPLGSQVSLLGQSSEPAFVGFDGTAYLDTFKSDNVLVVTTSSVSCKIPLHYPDHPKGIPKLGPFTCITKVSP